jgi:glycosyltransferase involved in cell wall biosynthesis
MPSTTPISAFMLTCNNMRTVEKALESITWVDELIVVDSGSTDGTLELVKDRATRVIERPWPGFREQYQFAADACNHTWALFIDADEVVTAELADEMRTCLDENADRPMDQQVAGYIAPRRTWYIDRWIRHGAWASDSEIRLYNRQRGGWEGGLHACIHVDGPTQTLHNVYQHYTYADIADHIDTVNRYSTTGAAEMAEKGKQTNGFRAFFGALARFCRDYILKRGFLDGFPGLVIAVSSAYNAFIKHAKLSEIRRNSKR